MHGAQSDEVLNRHIEGSTKPLEGLETCPLPVEKQAFPQQSSDGSARPRTDLSYLLSLSIKLALSNAAP